MSPRAGAANLTGSCGAALLLGAIPHSRCVFRPDPTFFMPRSRKRAERSGSVPLWRGMEGMEGMERRLSHAPPSSPVSVPTEAAYAAK